LNKQWMLSTFVRGNATRVATTIVIILVNEQRVPGWIGLKISRYRELQTVITMRRRLDPIFGGIFERNDCLNEPNVALNGIPCRMQPSCESRHNEV
jgi:hypothetical protein